jgi:hypothetical protein
MEELRGHLVGDESIFTFTRGGADFRDPTAVFRLNPSHGIFHFFVIPNILHWESILFFPAGSGQNLSPK